MKFCSQCGKQLPDETVFCSNCGNKVGNPVPNANAYGQNAYNPNAYNNPSPNNAYGANAYGNAPYGNAPYGNPYAPPTPPPGYMPGYPGAVKAVTPHKFFNKKVVTIFAITLAALLVFWVLFSAYALSQLPGIADDAIVQWGTDPVEAAEMLENQEDYTMRHVGLSILQAALVGGALALLHVVKKSTFGTTVATIAATGANFLVSFISLLTCDWLGVFWTKYTFYVESVLPFNIANCAISLLLLAVMIVYAVKSGMLRKQG